MDQRDSPDTGLDLFGFSSRQDSTDNEIEIKVKAGAVPPERECKQILSCECTF